MDQQRWRAKDTGTYRASIIKPEVTCGLSDGDTVPRSPVYPQGHRAEDNHFQVEWELHQSQESALDALPGRAVYPPGHSPAICLPIDSSVQVAGAKEVDVCCRSAQSQGEAPLISPEASFLSTISAPCKWECFLKIKLSLWSCFSYLWLFSSKNPKPEGSLDG